MATLSRVTHVSATALLCMDSVSQNKFWTESHLRKGSHFLDRDRDLFVELVIFVIDQLEIIQGEIIEVLDVGIDPELGRLVGLELDDALDRVNVSVIDMRVGDHMQECADLKTAHLREHMQEDRVLADVPVVRDQHILRALVENHVQLVLRDVQRDAVGAGIEPHLVQVVMVIDIGHDAAGFGMVLEVEQHTIHLIELALGIDMLDAQLIAVRLADGAVLIRPAVPDMALELMDIVALLLPDPQQLVDTALEKDLAERHDRELLREVIAIHDAELLDRMGGRVIVAPVRAHVHPLVGKTVFDNILTIRDKTLVSIAHTHPSFFYQLRSGAHAVISQ